MVHVAVGDHEILARITRRAADQLALQPGDTRARDPQIHVVARDHVARAFAGQRADELLYRRPADLVFECVAFRLDVDGIQAQRILIDDAVDATVTCALSHVGIRQISAPITHRRQKIEDHAFKANG
jgi:hypothetical protein